MTTCPVCRAAGPHTRFELREMMFGTRERFGYLRCEACGTIHIESVPADLSRHYPERYHYERLDEQMRPGNAVQRWLVRQVVAPELAGRRSLPARAAGRLLRPYVQPLQGYRRWRTSLQRWGVDSPHGGVLDVGCGSIPNRLVALRALGFRHLLGVDPFIAGDLRVEGVAVRKARIEDLEEGIEPFDHVWFHHSLEHVPDPVSAVAAAARLLRPGGRLVVRTPVMGTALWERYGTDWWELDPPRHLVVFTNRALIAMVVQAGFELEQVLQETHPKEFVGSEQYRRDLAMFEPGSWFVDPPSSAVGEEQWQAHVEDARRANEEGRAGRASFRFRRLAGTPPAGGGRDLR